MAEAQGFDESRFDKDIPRQLICIICMNVLKSPVLCRQNEHSFCRACIVHHLKYKKECPVCKDELTLDTLRTSKLLNSMLCDLKIKCQYQERGCHEMILLEFIDKHVENCGFAPVSCSNRNCIQVVNKRDLTYHETEQCPSRKSLKCDHCSQLEEKIDLITNKLVYVHDLVEVNMNTITHRQEESREKMFKRQVKLEEKLQKIEENCTNTHKIISDLREEVRSLSTTNVKLVKKLEGKDGSKKPKIVVTGGSRMEVMEEMFDFTTMTWTPIQPMINDRVGASSFVYNQQILVTGGVCGPDDETTSTVEAIGTGDIQNANWSTCSFILPTDLEAHTTEVYNNGLLVIGGRNSSDTISDNIWQVKLQTLYNVQLLTQMPEGRYDHGSVLIHNKVYIFGGITTEYVYLDSVIAYDIATKECHTMPALPYKLSDMSVVSYANNVIVIGGYMPDTGAIRKMFMYDITSGKSYSLPGMIYKRYGCSAVVIGREIIVMGGKSEEEVDLKTVEVFSFDSLSWRELPSMIEARSWASAVTI